MPDNDAYNGAKQEHITCQKGLHGPTIYLQLSDKLLKVEKQFVTGLALIGLHPSHLRTYYVLVSLTPRRIPANISSHPTSQLTS